MSLTPFELALVEPTIVVVPWYDDVVDPIGHDPRSRYVEMFWLNVLGPTATWILRRMVTGLDEYPGGYELDLEQTASALGLTFTPGAANPFARSLNRCVLFGAAQPIAGGLAVRRRLPPVANRHLQRMPPYLRAAHESWSGQSIPAAHEVARARGLARAMVDVGDPIDALERQLLGLGVPPRAALEAMADLTLQGTGQATGDWGPDAA
jgi:hypothetical protein